MSTPAPEVQLSTNPEDYNLEEIRDALIVIAKRAGDMMIQARSTKPAPGTLAKKNSMSLSLPPPFSPERHSTAIDSY
jgi:hypothetical protein